MSVFADAVVEPNDDTKVDSAFWISEVSTKLKEIDTFVSNQGNFLPSGVIVMWSGSIANIPTGWVLCNGLNGTPDLRDRFIVGAGNSYAVGATGGESTHVLLEAEMPAHNHGSVGNHTHSVPYTLGTVATGSASIFHLQGGGIQTGSAGGHAHTTQGSGAAHENRPPYYALAYIMKT